jgi:hypothetical protein
MAAATEAMTGTAPGAVTEAAIGGLLDLDRYPLDRLDEAAGRALLEACRRDLPA